MTTSLSILFAIGAIVYIVWPHSWSRMDTAKRWRLQVGFWAVTIVALAASAAIRERPSWDVVAGITAAALALGYWQRPHESE